MSKKLLAALALLVPISIVVGLIVYASQQDIAVLSPSGDIARQQKDLLVFAFWLSMVIILPVFALTIFITLHYRANNKKAKHTPDWGHDKKLEAIWWGIPILIIIVLSVITWQTSHSLDPYKPLDSASQPLEVKVVAMEWKWLFLYPEQNVASVNYLKLPTNRPINFVITADAPMNSFWIPNLGGQVYAMNGMSTKLHLIANEPGEFKGRSANISGEGFADMQFDTSAVGQSDFEQWINTAKINSDYLDAGTYAELAQPSVQSEPIIYSAFTPNLYDTIIGKYMPHASPKMQMKMEKH